MSERKYQNICTSFDEIIVGSELKLPTKGEINSNRKIERGENTRVLLTIAAVVPFALQALAIPHRFRAKRRKKGATIKANSLNNYWN